jgi:hypothetical protein
MLDRGQGDNRVETLRRLVRPVGGGPSERPQLLLIELRQDRHLTPHVDGDGRAVEEPSHPPQQLDVPPGLGQEAPSSLPVARASAFPSSRRARAWRSAAQPTSMSPPAAHVA